MEKQETALDRSWRKLRLILRRGRPISNSFGAKAHANVLKGAFSTNCKSNWIRIGLLLSIHVGRTIFRFVRTAYYTWYVYLHALHGFSMCGARKKVYVPVCNPRAASPLSPYTTSREVNEARRPHTCSRPCAFEKKNEPLPAWSRRTQNTPRNPQQAGDRDHLETACDETRPKR